MPVVVAFASVAESHGVCKATIVAFANADLRFRGLWCHQTERASLFLRDQAHSLRSEIRTVLREVRVSTCLNPVAHQTRPRRVPREGAYMQAQRSLPEERVLDCNPAPCPCRNLWRAAVAPVPTPRFLTFATAPS